MENLFLLETIFEQIKILRGNGNNDARCRKSHYRNECHQNKDYQNAHL